MSPRTSTPSPPAAVDEIPYDGLFRTIDPRADCQAVRRSLDAFNAKLSETFRTADAAAVRHQRHHKWIVALAGGFGTCAILLAIVQLAFSANLSCSWAMRAGGETFAVTVAAVAVIFGLLAARHHSWLIHRHKAEQCRLVKWRLLTDPGIWDADQTVRSATIDNASRQLEHVRRLRHAGVRKWIEDDDIPALPSARVAEGPPAFVSRYVQTELSGQKAYFDERLRSNLRLHTWTKHVALVAFLLSVVAAFAHFTIDAMKESRGRGDHACHDHSMASVTLLFVAAAIPVIAGAVRIFRAAFEPARNSARYRAKSIAIEHLMARLREEADPEQLVRDFWLGGQLLESEHREWLRLMMEAEWIG